MASEEARDMGLLLGNLTMGLLERVVFLNSEELVGVISSDNYNVVVLVVERTLNGDHGLALADTLERKALLLVPIP